MNFNLIRYIYMPVARKFSCIICKINNVALHIVMEILSYMKCTSN